MQRPDRDEPATRAAIEPDGWMHTGDIATRDEEGRYFIVGCRPHLAACKRPRSVRFVPDLPKTSTGKVMRRELKTLDD